MHDGYLKHQGLKFYILPGGGKLGPGTRPHQVWDAVHRPSLAHIFREIGVYYLPLRDCGGS